MHCIVLLLRSLSITIVIYSCLARDNLSYNTTFLREIIEVEDSDNDAEADVPPAKRQRVAISCIICLEDIVDDAGARYLCSTGTHQQCLVCFLRGLIVYHTDEGWSCENSTQVQQCMIDDCKDRGVYRICSLTEPPSFVNYSIFFFVPTHVIGAGVPGVILRVRLIFRLVDSQTGYIMEHTDPSRRWGYPRSSPFFHHSP